MKLRKLYGERLLMGENLLLTAPQGVEEQMVFVHWVSSGLTMWFSLSQSSRIGLSAYIYSLDGMFSLLRLYTADHV